MEKAKEKVRKSGLVEEEVVEEVVEEAGGKDVSES